MTLDILPNWHPVFVHFTVGLLFMSVALFLAAALIRKEPIHGQLLTVACWNLWLGTLVTVGTLLAGFYAFNTVPHQFEAQHLAMLDHRKWALGTAALFVFLAFWSLISTLRGRGAFTGWVNVMFLALLLAAGASLAATGYKGGELVFRHGLGVMAQPVAQEEHHDSHDHTGHDDHPH